MKKITTEEDKLAREAFDWLDGILGKHIALFSTKKDEILSLDDGELPSFNHLFYSLRFKKALFYDKDTEILSTYCPYTPPNFHLGRYKKIESNEQFRWILEYLFEKKWDLMDCKPVYIKIEDYGHKTKWITGINRDGILKRIDKIVSKLPSLTPAEKYSMRCSLLRTVNNGIPSQAKVIL